MSRILFALMLLSAACLGQETLIFSDSTINVYPVARYTTPPDTVLLEIIYADDNGNIRSVDGIYVRSKDKYYTKNKKGYFPISEDEIWGTKPRKPIKTTNK